ncbi:unnamed protein product [Cuscuta campestris]|uniref:Uncharacterized protein n=1 Tax=Cuscuta campestris TaxID=132261 RepID=A0A484NDF0_9ASTE|nr:unnamed protein product [Cuscuta campestris]
MGTPLLPHTYPLSITPSSSLPHLSITPLLSLSLSLSISDFSDEAGASDYRKTSPPRAPFWSSSFFLCSNPYFAILHPVHP